MISRPLIILLFALMSNLLLAQADPYIYVLGVVQDAGYPQAGCYQAHCLPAWENAELRRGATSIAAVDPVANS